MWSVINTKKRYRMFPLSISHKIIRENLSFLLNSKLNYQCVCFLIISVMGTVSFVHIKYREDSAMRNGKYDFCQWEGADVKLSTGKSTTLLSWHSQCHRPKLSNWVCTINLSFTAFLAPKNQSNKHWLGGLVSFSSRNATPIANFKTL